MAGLREELAEAFHDKGTREALAVGVTGHRWNRIDAQARPLLADALADAFRAIDALPGRVKTLLCGMAEGADLVAAALRPSHWRLAALLPLPASDWADYLELHAMGDAAAAAREFRMALAAPNVEETVLSPGLDGAPDFSALAEALVARSDLLVAVWDEKPGLPGGTRDVIAAALQRNLPVLHIPARGSVVGEPRMLRAVSPPLSPAA